jgi:hypothetical protein
MPGSLQIVYHEFYDVPRMLIVNRRGFKLLLDSPFEESLDDYSPSYKVYVLPDKVDEHGLKSWQDLPQMATKLLGEIPVDQVVFDVTKRSDIDADTIDRFLDSR